MLAFHHVLVHLRAHPGPHGHGEPTLQEGLQVAQVHGVHHRVVAVRAGEVLQEGGEACSLLPEHLRHPPAHPLQHPLGHGALPLTSISPRSSAATLAISTSVASMVDSSLRLSRVQAACNRYRGWTRLLHLALGRGLQQPPVQVAELAAGGGPGGGVGRVLGGHQRGGQAGHQQPLQPPELRPPLLPAPRHHPPPHTLHQLLPPAGEEHPVGELPPGGHPQLFHQEGRGPGDQGATTNTNTMMSQPAITFGGAAPAPGAPPPTHPLHSPTCTSVNPLDDYMRNKINQGAPDIPGNSG